MLGLRMQRAVDGDDVADLDHVLDGRMPGEIQLFLDRLRQTMAVKIVQMHVEWLQAAQYGETDAAGRDGADMHAFDVVGARRRNRRCSSRPSRPTGTTGCNCARATRIIMTTCSETLIELQ